MGMTGVAVWTETAYQKDALFDPTSSLNRDDCLSPFRELKKRLAGGGWDCHTQDVYLKSGEIPAAVLFLDIPARPVSAVLGDWAGKTRPMVVIQECEVVKPWNWDLGRHAQFDALFTWDERLLDGRRYFRLNFSNHFPESINPPPVKSKLCVMVAAHKRKPHRLELYSERERAIRWFEQNHPGDFDLYGVGWDRHTFSGPRIVRALNRLTPLTRLLAGRFPSYRGKVDQKRPVMEKYSFSVCYENAKEIPGYITEKIFDSFFAGCIPIYWGAPDIEKHIPADCFIDRREFANYEELYSYIKNMSEADRLRKLDAIRAFMSSSAARFFRDTYFAETISKVISGA